MTWQALCLMAYTVVWGFGNTVNGFANQGLKVVVSWMILFLFYFIPYTLMVGEMGATFENGAGGVSSWIKETMSSKLAFFAGWTFWVVNIPYLAQKPQNILIAMGWAIFQNDQLTTMISPMMLQLISLGIFMFFMWYAAQGVSALKRIGSIAGSFMFIMSILYVLLVLAAPYITEAKTFSYSLSWDTFMPNFNFEYMTTLSILVFAVGGCERIAPYVTNLQNPDKEFPRAMIVMTAMVAVTAVLGTFAMGLMFDPNNVPKDLMMNGAYYCFAKLGAYYGVGRAFVILYAICQFFGQAATLAISIDAPIKFLLSDVDPKFVPHSFTKINEKGIPVSGYKLTGILVSILIIGPWHWRHDNALHLAPAPECHLHAAVLPVGLPGLYGAQTGEKGLQLFLLPYKEQRHRLYDWFLVLCPDDLCFAHGYGSLRCRNVFFHLVVPDDHERRNAGHPSWYRPYFPYPCTPRTGKIGRDGITLII